MIPHSTTPPPGAGTDVLVVEDDDVVRSVLRRMLAFAGSRAYTAADAAGAVALTIAQPSLAFALIDLSLNGPDGVATAQALHAVRPDLPIVLMSGDPARAEAVQRSAGAVGVLSKPCAIEDLAALVASAGHLEARHELH